MKIRILFKTIGFLLAIILATSCTVQEDQDTAEKVVENTVTDIDGNVYQTVTIGNQVWMAENLRTTRYRNGDFIGTTSPATLDYSNESTPKYQWAYDGDESNVALYGRLYTWYAVTDSRNIAPVGWHVPTNAEWTTLINYLGGGSVAGGKLKEAGTTHWASPNTGATNESGFTALPSGTRGASPVPQLGVVFLDIGRVVHYWSATEYNAQIAWRYLLFKDGSEIQMGYSVKKIGWSVRCIKD